MSKGLRVGAQNISRNGKKGYFGVNDVPKKIKKIYVGDSNNVPQLGYNAQTGVYYYGLAPNLSQAKDRFAACSLPDYAIFAGGYGSDNVGSQFFDSVDAYTSSLTRALPTVLSESKDWLASAVANQVALFVGGYIGDYTETNSIDYFSSSLVKGSASYGKSVDHFVGTSLADFAVFAGGRTHTSASSTTTSNQVYKIDQSVTQTAFPNMSNSRYDHGGASVGDYAIFAGGRNSTSVEAYSASGTKASSVTSLPAKTEQLVGVSSGDYAIFAGGYNSTNQVMLADVATFDAQLTKSYAPNLSNRRTYPSAVFLGGYTLIGGGQSVNRTTGVPTYYDTVDVYDTSLTRSVLSLSAARWRLASAIVGNKLLFAGGGIGATTQSSADVTDVVDVFEVS